MFSDEVHFSFGQINTAWIIRNEEERNCNDCMQFVHKKEVNCFHISAMVGWNYKGPLIFYNTPEITVKGKVKGRKWASKKGEKAATTEAVTEAQNHGELPDNMTSEEAKRKEGGNMTMETYIEQILKPHFGPALKKLAAERGQAILEEDNDGAHGTHSVKNKVQAYKKKEGIESYANPPASPDLSIIESVWRILKQAVKKHNCGSIPQLRWAIEYKWSQIPQSKINKYVLTMPHRIFEVIKRQGLSTQY